MSNKALLNGFMVGKRKTGKMSKILSFGKNWMQVCAGRDIEWNWIKGHAGHAGNEMADQLANLGCSILKSSRRA
jgi:ribonuclease HI